MGQPILSSSLGAAPRRHRPSLWQGHPHVVVVAVGAIPRRRRPCRVGGVPASSSVVGLGRARVALLVLHRGGGPSPRRRRPLLGWGRPRVVLVVRRRVGGVPALSSSSFVVVGAVPALSSSFVGLGASLRRR